MQAVMPQPAPRRWRERFSPNGEWILLLALVCEVGAFSAIAQNFLTLGNFFEIIRASTELGLLALALTPVIITGGIDLSIGSMMGLAAVVFGAAWQDWHVPLGLAAMIALLVGCAGGALNALLISRLCSGASRKASRGEPSITRIFRNPSCLPARVTCWE
jgi:rhamnose transport system permease protein